MLNKKKKEKDSPAKNNLRAVKGSREGYNNAPEMGGTDRECEKGRKTHLKRPKRESRGR